eukprot:6446389-Lingulodinium_polyedra.AAC.1
MECCPSAKPITGGSSLPTERTARQALPARPSTTHAALNGSTSSPECNVTGQHPTILEPTKVGE